MEMLALTFFSWAVMSAKGWSLLEVDGVALVGVSVVVGSGGWPIVGVDLLVEAGLLVE